MKYYGIRHKQSGRWLEFDSGAIFWTTSRMVAEAQLLHLAGTSFDNSDAFEIAEFE